MRRGNIRYMYIFQTSPTLCSQFRTCYLCCQYFMPVVCVYYEESLMHRGILRTCQLLFMVLLLTIAAASLTPSDS